MPTKYRPSLDHVGFNWTKDLDEIRSKLLARWDCILAELHFVEKSGCIAIANSSGAVSLKTARDCLLDEISGIVALAAAVQMDAGFKAANKVIATVDAVRRAPSIILTHNVEPEALGVIALKYQRADEPPGTYWYDIYQDENAVAVDLQQVAYAARQASLQLRAERRKGVPQDRCLSISPIFARFLNATMLVQGVIRYSRQWKASSSRKKGVPF